MQGGPRAIGLGMNEARPGARRGVGEKGLDRITKTAVPTKSVTITMQHLDSTGFAAPIWRSGAFGGGGDRLGGTRDGDGTWTESKSVVDRHQLCKQREWT